MPKNNAASFPKWFLTASFFVKKDPTQNMWSQMRKFTPK